NFLFPVGRLDRSSEGLLILTNDGELAYRLTHPKFKVPKTYLVTINGNIQKPQIVRLLEGIEDRGQLLRAKSVKLLKASSERSELEIILTEGKNREIRRMFNRLGFKVHRLIRTRIGPIHLGELRVGKWRFLTKSEVQALYNSANRMD
ncbi:MAG: pseudouridine synthase, partial [candidate division WOR-3 bacterium]